LTRLRKENKALKKRDMALEKTSGVKPCATVDTGSLPHAVWMTATDATDRDGAVKMLRKCAPNLTKVAKALCGGYRGENFAIAAGVLIGAEADAVKRSELHTFVELPRRRTVECSFGWLENSPSLENCKRKIHEPVPKHERVLEQASEKAV
jgi:hypothetical protein